MSKILHKGLFSGAQFGWSLIGGKQLNFVEFTGPWDSLLSYRLRPCVPKSF
jgi:hypothetical protein